MPKRILLLGAGRQVKVDLDIIAEMACDWSVGGCLDVYDNPELWGKSVAGIPILGGMDSFDECLGRSFDAVALAVGNCGLRRKLFAVAHEADIEVVALIHPSASVSRSASLGRGVIIHAGAVIGASARLGDGVMVNTSASVDHDCVIGDFSHIAPGAHLSGGVIVGSCTWVGIGSAVIEDTTIGSNVLLGAGSVVVDDLPDNVKAFGTPARIRDQLPPGAV